MDQKHEFAFYVPSLSHYPKKQGALSSIDDEQTVNRIRTILRLVPGDTIVLFDKTGMLRATLETVEKKTVSIIVDSYRTHEAIQPSITVLLPLLKKQAFEETIYSMVELGVTTIRLVYTAKAQRTWSGDKERERIERIMIAACEQSKNFLMPSLFDPIELDTIPNNEWHRTSKKIYFDAHAIPLLEVLQMINPVTDSILCMAGPEGDLTATEKQFLKTHGFIFCALTPTILRASQAFTVGVGALRSIS